MNRQILVLPAVIFIHLYLLAQSSFTVWPEMILYPYLMNNGFLLFKDIINPYFPLLSIILSQTFSITGLTVFNLKAITYILIIFLDIVVFLSTARLTKKISKAILATIIYALLQISFGGNGLWFELALAPFLFYSLVTLYFSTNRFQLMFAGLSLAVAVLIKQNAILFYIPAILLLQQKRFGSQAYSNFANTSQLCCGDERSSDQTCPKGYSAVYCGVVYFLLPGVILGFVTLAYLQTSDILNDFYYWAVKLPLSFSSQHGFVLLPTKKQYLLMLFLMVPSITIFVKRWSMREKLYWFFSAVIAISFAFPRYENFHLQVLAGISAIFATMMGKKKLILFILLSLVIFASTYAKIWHKEDRFLDRDMYLLSDKIKVANSVYLLNSPDLAYFFANKLPPKPWAINFPWYFKQPGFEDRFISGLTNNKTEYVIVRDQLGGNEYDLGNYMPEKLLDYISKNYTLVENYYSFKIWQLNP